MKHVRRLTLLVLMLPLAACTVNGFTVSTIEPPAERQVRAEKSVFNVLGLNPTTLEEIDELRDSLSEQCGDAGVTGVVTLSYTIFAIIGVVEKSEVVGYCMES